MASKLVRAGKHKTVNGVDYFRVRYKLHGGWRDLYQHMDVKFTTLEDAKRLAHIIENRFAENEDMRYAVAPFVPGGSKPLLVLPLMRQFLQERELQVGAGLLSENTLCNMRRWVPSEADEGKRKASRQHYGFWAGKGLLDVSKLSLMAFHRFLAVDQELADTSRVTVLGEFRTFLRWAVEMELLPAVPVFPKVKVEEKRKRPLEPEEQDRVVAAIPKPKRGIFMVCATYGVRPSAARAILVSALDNATDLLSIRAAVQGNGPSARVGTTKARKQNEVALTQELRDWIDEFCSGRLPTARLFWNPDARNDGQRWGLIAMQRTWKRACADAGVRYVSLYPGTKHSTATKLRAEGHSSEHIGAFIQVAEKRVDTYAVHDSLRLTAAMLGEERLTEKARAALKRWRKSDRPKTV